LVRRWSCDAASMPFWLGALFLSFTTEYSQEIFSLLFGEVLGVSAGEVLLVALVALLCVAAIAVARGRHGARRAAVPGGAAFPCRGRARDQFDAAGRGRAAGRLETWPSPVPTRRRPARGLVAGSAH
jgi:ABC 3 transport family